MLFRKSFLDGIRSGDVTLAFRRWRRPTVRAGSDLLTPIGQLRIEAIRPVALSSISAADAKLAGYPSQAALLDELKRRSEGKIYRIEFGSLRPDPRIALRESHTLTKAELAELAEKLRRLDARATNGAWTIRTLEALKSHPGLRAGALCRIVEQQKEPFKLNVRKLKNLGLTESLGTGYRLSPRGETLLDRLRSTAYNDSRT